MKPAFTILYTNDLHNHLSVLQAEKLSRLRTEIGPNGLLLDAGDAVGAGNITFRPGGEAILQTMSRIGYDAMTVGNREFHFSHIGFQTKLSMARFPALCANVRASRQHIPESDRILDGQTHSATIQLPVIPYIVRDFGDNRRIVIFGVTVPMITERMLVRKVSSFVFDDPIHAAALLVPTLRERFAPDLLIALTHIGIQKDRELAMSVPGIDLIIGGHTHVVLEHGEKVGKTWIFQAGCRGAYFGRIEVRDPIRSDPKWQFDAWLETL